MSTEWRDGARECNYRILVVLSRSLQTGGNFVVGDCSESKETVSGALRRIEGERGRTFSSFESSVDAVLVLLGEFVEAVELSGALKLVLDVAPDFGGDAVEMSPRKGRLSLEIDDRADCAT